MNTFPRTTIESLSVPRLIMGTNWILGVSHTSKAKDDLIRSSMDVHRMADVMVAFLEQGVDAILGFRPDPVLVAAVKEAEDRAGRKMIRITTPGLNVETGPKAEAENARTLACPALAGEGVGGAGVGWPVAGEWPGPGPKHGARLCRHGLEVGPQRTGQWFGRRGKYGKYSKRPALRGVGRGPG